MTEPLRRNRCGLVLIADIVPEEAKALVCQRLLITGAERCGDGVTQLTGYCAEFDALELGMTPPTYDALITQDAAGGMTLEFRRRAP